MSSARTSRDASARKNAGSSNAGAVHEIICTAPAAAACCIAVPDDGPALHRAAQRLRARGDLRTARVACARAVAAFERVAGRDHPDTAHARVELGEILEGLGAFADAARCLRRAVASLAHADGPADVRVLAIRAALDEARVLQAGGRLHDSERAYRAAAALARRARSAEGGVAALTGLGVLRKAQGRYAQAAACYRRALALARGREERATLYHNLAGLAHARGRLEEAELLARRGIVLRRRARGPRELLIADLAALAPILDGLGERAEAATLYRRALAFHRRRSGPRSYEVAVTLANLGALQRHAGRLAAAERTLRAALAAHEASLGRRHAETALTLNNLGAVLAARGAPADARRCYTRALRVLVATVGRDHPYHRAAARNLARLGGER